MRGMKPWEQEEKAKQNNPSKNSGVKLAIGKWKKHGRE